MRFAISPHIEKVHFPPISEVKGWVAGREFPADRPLVDLCQAVPDYAPAPQLTDHLKGLLDDPLTSKYSPDEGLLEARARRFVHGTGGSTARRRKRKSCA